MNHDEILARAFEAITWSDEPFEPGMGDLDRLDRSASSASATMALHSLARIHGWLWPKVKSASEGTVLVIGDMVAETIRDDEDGKFVSLSIADDRWMLSWGGMEGEEPTIRLGLADPDRDSGQRRMAYCTLPPSGRRSGRLLAEGGDVGRMFGMFAHLRVLMPAEHLSVLDGSRNDDSLTDFELDRVLELDGGIAGTAAAQLHRMAEQHAASVIFQWAADKYDRVSRFLVEKGFVYGSRALTFNDGERTICGVETGDEDKMAFFDSRFPHERSGNRFLTWIDYSYNGAVAAVHSFAIPAGAELSNAVDLLKSCDIEPTLTHEYATGRTIVSSDGIGMRHLASMARAIDQASHLVARFDPKNEGDDYELIAMGLQEPGPAIGR